jgi:hypothetical protein
MIGWTGLAPWEGGGSGFRIWDLGAGFGIWVQDWGFGFRIWDLGAIWDLGGFGFRVHACTAAVSALIERGLDGVGCRVSGVGCRVWG